MERAPVGADYAASVGAVHAMRDATDGTQPGDPERAAQIIAAVVGDPEPPRRLLLGAAAVEQARAAGAARAAELERWADTSASADYQTVA